jgi:hypothetical protein
LGAIFSATFFRALASRLAAGAALPVAFAECCDELESAGIADLWRDLACLELLGGP